MISHSVQVEGGKIKIHMKSGWVFGDTALLFQSPRSASIVASTPIELWAMDRRTFHKVSHSLLHSLLIRGSRLPDIQEAGSRVA